MYPSHIIHRPDQIRWINRYLDGLVGIRDEGDEERQHHVDEEGDEGVEVGPAEEPHQRVFVLQLSEGGEHVVTVQQREQTFCHQTQTLELERRRRTDHRSLDRWSQLTLMKKDVIIFFAIHK